jgi:hypothetical protein
MATGPLTKSCQGAFSPPEMEILLRNIICECFFQHCSSLVIPTLLHHEQFSSTIERNIVSGYDYQSDPCTLVLAWLKVHKNENFFGFDFEFCTISLLGMHK